MPCMSFVSWIGKNAGSGQDWSRSAGHHYSNLESIAVTTTLWNGQCVQSLQVWDTQFGCSQKVFFPGSTDPTSDIRSSNSIFDGAPKFWGLQSQEPLKKGLTQYSMCEVTLRTVEFGTESRRCCYVFYRLTLQHVHMYILTHRCVILESSKIYSLP